MLAPRQPLSRGEIIITIIATFTHVYSESSTAPRALGALLTWILTTNR